MQTHFSLGTHFSQSAPQTKWRHSSSPVSTYSSTNLKIRKIYLPSRASGEERKNEKKKKRSMIHISRSMIDIPCSMENPSRLREDEK